MAKKTKDVQYYEGVGRRDVAVARVRLYITNKEKSATVNGKKVQQGQMLINERPFEEIYTRAVDKKKCLMPLELTNNLDRFAISVHVFGGGKVGQLEAIVHGLSRALDQVNPDEYHSTLRQNSLLTRDPRARERRMVGTGGKARRAKQSPKR